MDENLDNEFSTMNEHHIIYNTNGEIFRREKIHNLTNNNNNNNNNNNSNVMEKYDVNEGFRIFYDTWKEEEIEETKMVDEFYYDEITITPKKSPKRTTIDEDDFEVQRGYNTRSRANGENSNNNNNTNSNNNGDSRRNRGSLYSRYDNDNNNDNSNRYNNSRRSIRLASMRNDGAITNTSDDTSMAGMMDDDSTDNENDSDYTPDRRSNTNRNINSSYHKRSPKKNKKNKKNKHGNGGRKGKGKGKRKRRKAATRENSSNSIKQEISATPPKTITRRVRKKRKVRKTQKFVSKVLHRTQIGIVNIENHCDSTGNLKNHNILSVLSILSKTKQPVVSFRCSLMLEQEYIEASQNVGDETSADLDLNLENDEQDPQQAAKNSNVNTNASKNMNSETNTKGHASSITVKPQADGTETTAQQQQDPSQPDLNTNTGRLRAAISLSRSRTRSNDSARIAELCHEMEIGNSAKSSTAGSSIRMRMRLSFGAFQRCPQDNNECTVTTIKEQSPFQLPNKLEISGNFQSDFQLPHYDSQSQSGSRSTSSMSMNTHGTVFSAYHNNRNDDIMDVNSSVFDVAIGKDNDNDNDNHDVNEELIGKYQFVSGILLINLWVSKFIFDKNLLKSIQSRYAFELLIDLIDDNEIRGVSEMFALTYSGGGAAHANNKNRGLKLDTSTLYEKLRPSWKNQCEKQPGGLVYPLMNFQRKAVNWMIYREQQTNLIEQINYKPMILHNSNNDKNNNRKQANDNSNDNSSTREEDHFMCWFNIDNGKFVRDEPYKLFDIQGGILADQMGLGKTVECIGLMQLQKQRYWSNGKRIKQQKQVQSLPAIEAPVKTADGEDSTMKKNNENENRNENDSNNNNEKSTSLDSIITLGSSKDEEIEMKQQASKKVGTNEIWEIKNDYTELDNLILQSTLNDANNDKHIDAEWLELYKPENNSNIEFESMATLIVCPANIVHQWQNEIEKHAPHMSVFIYDGNAHHQKKMKQWKTKRLREMEKQEKAKRKMAKKLNKNKNTTKGKPKPKSNTKTKRKSKSSTKNKKKKNNNDGSSSDSEIDNQRNKQRRGRPKKNNTPKRGRKSTQSKRSNRNGGATRGRRTRNGGNGNAGTMIERQEHAFGSRRSPSVNDSDGSIIELTMIRQPDGDPIFVRYDPNLRNEMNANRVGGRKKRKSSTKGERRRKRRRLNNGQRDESSENELESFGESEGYDDGDNDNGIYYDGYNNDESSEEVDNADDESYEPTPQARRRQKKNSKSKKKKSKQKEKQKQKQSKKEKKKNKKKRKNKKKKRKKKLTQHSIETQDENLYGYENEYSNDNQGDDYHNSEDYQDTQDGDYQNDYYQNDGYQNDDHSNSKTKTKNNNKSNNKSKSKNKNKNKSKSKNKSKKKGSKRKGNGNGSNRRTGTNKSSKKTTSNKRKTNYRGRGEDSDSSYRLDDASYGSDSSAIKDFNPKNFENDNDKADEDDFDSNYISSGESNCDRASDSDFLPGIGQCDGAVPVGGGSDSESIDISMNETTDLNSSNTLNQTSQQTKDASISIDFSFSDTDDDNDNDNGNKNDGNNNENRDKSKSVSIDNENGNGNQDKNGNSNNMNDDGFEKRSFDASARNIASYDIVLTSYEAIQAEVHYSKECSYGFRRTKRYLVPQCPLLHIRWWRLILDEAQQVENTTANTAKMAQRYVAKIIIIFSLCFFVFWGFRFLSKFPLWFHITLFLSLT